MAMSALLIAALGWSGGPMPLASTLRARTACMRGSDEWKTNFQSTRIFVRNLSYNTDWGALKDHFRNAGFPTVYASISTDQETGESKGHGIVQFETVDAALAAIDEMSGSVLDGREIYCREDRKEKGGGRDRYDDRRADRYDRGDRYDDFRGGRYSDGGDDRYDDRYDGGGRGGYARGRGGGRGGRRDGYMRERGDDAEVDVARVEALIAERDDLRWERDFDGADAIRDELRDMGVAIFDRDRSWRVERAGWMRESSSRERGPPRGSAGREVEEWEKKEWSRAEGTADADSDVDEAAVEELLARRDSARETRDYATAGARGPPRPVTRTVGACAEYARALSACAQMICSPSSRTGGACASTTRGGRKSGGWEIGRTGGGARAGGLVRRAGVAPGTTTARGTSAAVPAGWPAEDWKAPRAHGPQPAALGPSYRRIPSFGLRFGAAAHRLGTCRAAPAWTPTRRPPRKASLLRSARLPRATMRRRSDLLARATRSSRTPRRPR